MGAYSYGTCSSNRSHFTGQEGGEIAQKPLYARTYTHAVALEAPCNQIAHLEDATEFANAASIQCGLAARRRPLARAPTQRACRTHTHARAHRACGGELGGPGTWKSNAYGGCEDARVRVPSAGAIAIF